MNRSLWPARRLAILAIGGLTMALAGLSIVAGALAAPPSGASNPPLNVVVLNTPLPVTGSLEVSGDVGVTGDVGVSGTVGATQSGTWNVGLTGTPTVRSGDQTVLVGSFAGDVLGNNQFTEAITQRDATPYRTIRVATNCFDGSACANIFVRVYTVVGNRSYLIDQFPMQNFVVAGGTYDVIGTSVAVQLLNTNASTNTNIGVAVFGRPN